jgi:hypothetical protein
MSASIGALYLGDGEAGLSSEKLDAIFAALPQVEIEGALGFIDFFALLRDIACGAEEKLPPLSILIDERVPEIALLIADVAEDDFEDRLGAMTLQTLDLSLIPLIKRDAAYRRCALMMQDRSLRVHPGTYNMLRAELELAKLCGAHYLGERRLPDLPMESLLS